VLGAIDQVNLLSCGIVQLVLPGALEAVLDTNILPKRLDGVANLRRQVVTLDLLWLHEDSLDVVFGALVVEWQLERLHRLQDDAHRLDCVAEDDLLERLALVARVAALVDELHLLEDGGLSGFTGTYRGVRERPVGRKIGVGGGD
jgi:hypothetical protein